MITAVQGNKEFKDEFSAAGAMFSKLIFYEQYSGNQLFLLRFFRTGDCDTSSKKVTKRNEWDCFAHIKVTGNAKTHHYWQLQGTLLQVSVAGTVQGGLDHMCFNFAEFSSFLIHFSLSSTLKPTFFIFGWQSPAELIKSEASRIPSDFIEYVSCVFYAEDFLGMLWNMAEKSKRRCISPPFLACVMSNALPSVPAMSGEVWQLLTSSVPA